MPARWAGGNWERSSLFAHCDNSLSGVNRNRPDVAADWRLPDGRLRNERIPVCFNTAAFQENAPLTFGNAGRNILPSPGVLSIDTSLSKTFQLAEAHRLQLRFDALNLPTRPNFSNPNATLTSPAFGRIQGAGSGRILQVSAKYLF